MTDITIKGSLTFGEGTTVGAYPRNRWPVESVTGAPTGSAVSSGTVTGGTVTFTGLSDSTEYIAYAASPDRYKRFSTPPAAGGLIDVRLHGVLGDGVTDDLAALQSAISSASTGGHAIYLPRGTYIVSARLDLTVDLIAEPGAVIKKANGFGNDAAVRLAANNIEVRGLKIDGNRANGPLGGGLSCFVSTGCIARGVTVLNTTANGINASSGGTLDCYDCSSTNNVSGTGIVVGNGQGYACAASSRLRLYRCVGSDNDKNGVQIDDAALTGCHLDGEFSRNLRAGVELREGDGTFGRLRLDQNRNFGLLAGVNNANQPADRWVGDYLEASNTGLEFTNQYGTTTRDVSGTGVEIYGSSDWQVSTVVGRKNLGYDLAQAADTVGGCNRNLFGLLNATGGGAVDSDPSILIAGDSTRNVITRAVVRAKTFAVSIGEDFAGVPANNVIGHLIAESCNYGIVRVNKGDANRIDTIVGRDCSTIGNPTWTALLWFDGTSTTNNSIGRFTHRTISAAAPNALWSQGNGAVGNHLATPSFPARRRYPYAADNVVGESIPRINSVSNQAALTSQKLLVVGGLLAPGGEALTAVRFLSGTTALGTGVNQWACLIRHPDLVIVAVSPDDTSGAWAANSEKTFTFTTPWVADDEYHVFAGLLINATTVPSLMGINSSNPSTILSRTPVLAGGSNTPLTTPLAVGATVSPPVNQAVIPRVELLAAGASGW